MSRYAAPQSSFDSIHRASFLNQQAKLKRKWADLARNDPKRVVRALSLTTPRGLTVEGDEGVEMPYLFQELTKLAEQSTTTSQVWKGLVDAGVITALCKSTLNFQGTITYAAFDRNDDGTLNLSQDAMQDAADWAPSSFFLPMSILCSAILSCAVPPTSTEVKMVEELKRQWSTLMQKIWSDPARTLEDQNLRVRERAIIAQMIRRVLLLDPSFLDVIFKPSDLTLANVFRNWLYSTEEHDTLINSSLLASLLEHGKSEPWQRYLEEHHLPSKSVILSRILLGASKGPDKKKRTPNQAAELVVASFARHFHNFSDLAIYVEISFFDALVKATDQGNVQLYRALYKSAAFWRNLIHLMKQHAVPATNASRPMVEVFNEVQGLLFICHSMRQQPELDEHIDILVYNWVTSGLFDGIEAMLPTIMRSPTAIMFLGFMLTMIARRLGKLSTRTRAELRSELPRPRLQNALMQYATMGTSDPKQLLTIWQGNKFMTHPHLPKNDPRHPVWTQLGWSTLMTITFDLRPWKETCMKRGCENTALEGSCRRCFYAAYCSPECLRSDQDHYLLCKWVPVLWTAHQSDRREESQRGRAAKLLQDGYLSPEVVERKLEEMRAAGEFTDEEVVQWREAVNTLREKHKEEDAGPSAPTITEVQEAMANAALSDEAEAPES